MQEKAIPAGSLVKKTSQPPTPPTKVQFDPNAVKRPRNLDEARKALNEIFPNLPEA